jgi:hypothetical protein
MTRRTRFLPYTALFMLVLLVFSKLAFTDLILARGDTYLYFYPYWAARDAALSQGQLPLWTPDIFMGVPLLSDPQVGTFYPPNWLTVYLTPPEAIRISILLHGTWAAVGAFLLARRVVPLETLPALIAGAVFAFGGYLGAHVEQINQLQGVSWLPWALLAADYAFRHPLRNAPILAAVMALQVFSGHTQTVFITGAALGVFGVFYPHPLAPSPSNGEKAVRNGEGGKTVWLNNWRLAPLVLVFRRFGILMATAVIAVLLALPQLYPSLELTGLSNRGGGFSAQEAMAFSWNPLLAGRGLLPSYDAQVFGEYVAYIGVGALMLGLYGAFASDRRRWVWLALVVVGVFLAFGLYNPVYWMLAELPGFNLFRVPARWLALFAIGAAMLAGLGAQALITKPPRLRPLITAGILVGMIALSTLLSDRAAAEVDGQAVPGLKTWILWGAAAFLLVITSFRRSRYSPLIMTALVCGELWLASLSMPYNDLVDPAAYDDARFSVHQLQALQSDEPAPGRFLSISNAFFDPGDKAGLTQRYADIGLTERATRYAFTAAKLKEVIAPNLSLIWNIPTVDGYGGGVTPTLYYTQFTSLLLPDGMLRTVDGRLRELLAGEACRGACIPQQRYLDLMNTRYLIVDKTYDLSHEGIRYDTTFAFPGGTLAVESDFVATELRILYRGETLPDVAIFGGRDVLPLDVEGGGDVNGFKLIVAALDSPQPISGVQLQNADAFIALTLVDARTGDFVPIPLSHVWRLALSSDIKLYENKSVLPRAFVVGEAQFVPDTWDGTETALRMMREPAFNPADTVILSGDAPTSPQPADASALITHYTSTRVEIAVQTDTPAYLVLTDAYFPGWKGTINGETVSLYRANGMFRAMPVPAGSSTVVMEYAPDWLGWLLPAGGIVWSALCLWITIRFVSGTKRRRAAY